MPLKGSTEAAVLCTVTARSDTSMKMTNTVPIAYSTSSIENAVTQMLLVKVSSCGRRRLPSRIGSISTQPCMTGTTIVGQRFASSAAARSTIRKPSAPHRSRRSPHRRSAAWRNSRWHSQRPRRSRRSRRTPAPADWACGRGIRARRSRPCRRRRSRRAFSASNSVLAELRAADGPDRHRGCAEQIGRPPPFQGRDVLLLAEEHQHGPEHACDHRGKQI